MKLNDFKRGWLIGDFNPALIHSKDIEIGVKEFLKGESEPMHVHKSTKEYTIVLSGEIKMLGKIFRTGEICFVDAGVPSSFESLLDSQLLVIKSPSNPSDKEFI